MKFRRRSGLRRLAGLTTFFALALLPFAGSSALAVSGAAFTTDNPGTTDACLNGQPGHPTPAVNCNIYGAKTDVWINGGPSGGQNSLSDGSYFFAVLVPGGQPDPNDDGVKNLSDTNPLGGIDDSPGDAYTDRTFNIVNGHISGYTGPHAYDNTSGGALGELIQLWPYDTTSNPGGVYILAICSLDSGYPVNPRDCKYDAFKVKEANPPVTPPAAGADVTKDAAGAYKTTWHWDASKTVDKTLVKQIGGTATFTYTVTVTHDGGTNSDVNVTGTISVTNPNVDASNNVVPMDINSLTDSVSDGTTTTDCTVTGAPSGGGTVTLTAFETDFAYSCDLGSTLPSTLSNTVVVGWGDQDLNLSGDPSNLSHLAAGSSDFAVNGVAFTQTKVDDSVVVTDTFGLHGTTGTTTTLGSVSATDPSPTTFVYSRVINIPAHDCLTYDNLANFTTNTSSSTDGTLGDNAQSVRVCGPANTGALTMGFWKNTNGQNLINTYCQAGALGTYLRGLGAVSGPFSNAPSTCSTLKTYVYNILNGANATNMNTMLKAQMLTSALDVWFSGPGWTSTTLNKIKPPSNFLSHNNLGTFKMDTTAICPMVDSLSTGTATCKNNTPSTDAVAAGAVPTSPMSMQAILDFASTTPVPFNGSTSAPVWYAGDRTKQEILKNIFDQFNNGDAFGSF